MFQKIDRGLVQGSVEETSSGVLSDLPQASSLRRGPLQRGHLRGKGGLYSATSEEDWNSASWQLKNRFTDVASFAQVFGISGPRTKSAISGASSHRFSVTPYYANLIDPEDPEDPILRQVLPEAGEISPSQDLDPFLEQELMVAPGLVHRYPDRALFLLTNFCSTLCRHCMRKREWASGFRRLADDEIETSIAYVASHAQIRDVLISGGDPFELSPRILEKVISGLRSCEHVDLIRFGSRTLVSVPQQIDEGLLSILSAHSPIYVNTHFNHPRELSAESMKACHSLLKAGAILGNQSVLLAGVNDDEATLLELSKGLLRAGVRPYYLHHCDPIEGLDHFRVPLERARGLIRSLYGKVTGLGIPRLTVDLPGAGGKVPVDPGFEVAALPDGDVFTSPLTGKPVLVEWSLGSHDHSKRTTLS